MESSFLSSLWIEQNAKHLNRNYNSNFSWQQFFHRLFFFFFRLDRFRPILYLSDRFNFIMAFVWETNYLRIMNFSVVKFSFCKSFKQLPLSL